MSDTTYHVFQDGAGLYRVRITRLGQFIQEAEGFSSQTDAEAWVKQAVRLGAIRAGRQDPTARPHFRVV